MKKNPRRRKNDLSQNIRALRKQSGLTQTDLAKELGCTQATITFYENNVHMPPADQIPVIARILGVSIDQLYGVKELPQKQAGIKSSKLRKKFEEIDNLPPRDKTILTKMIDGLLPQNKKK